MEPTSESAPGGDFLAARLEAVRRKRDRASVLRGSFVALSVGLALAFLALVAEELLYLPPFARSALVWLIPLGCLGVFSSIGGAALLRLARLIAQEPDEETARFVGTNIPALGDRLLNGLQLIRAHESGTIQQLYSSDLVEAAINDLKQLVEPFDFTGVVGFAGSRRAARALGIGVGIILLLFIVAPSSFLGSAYRLWHMNEVFAMPAPFRLVVDPGDKEIIKGEAVRISVRAEGALPENVVLAVRPDGQVSEETHILTSDNTGEYRFDIPSIKTSTRYSVRSGSVRTREYVLHVVDRPLVRLLRLTVRPPAYTGLPSHTQEDNVGDVTALKGTRVSLELESNKDLATAAAQFHDGTEIALPVTGKKATGSFLLRTDGVYRIALKDSQGLANADPIEYTVKILPDAYPSISIVSPGMNLDITDNSALPLVIKIVDDFGFSRLRLGYKLVQSRYEQPWSDYRYITIPLARGIGTEALVPYSWPLTALHLVPEDAVSYHAEVFDNDAVSGPKSAVSEEFTLRLPSIDEVFADVDKGHEESLQNLQEAMTQANEARKDLQDLIKDAKKEQDKLDWQDRQKAEQLAKKYAALQQKMDDVKKTVDKMTQEMQKNRVLSKETMEKYLELQQLMEQMNTPEFAEALKQMQQAMQQMSPEAMRRALENFSFSEENFRKSIERTMNLLKRIQVEQKVDQIVKRLAEMEKEQSDLRDRTAAMKEGNKQEAAELAKRQEGLKQDTDELRKEMEELQKKMEEFPSEMPLPEMQKANKEMAASQLEEQLQQAAENIAASQSAQASQGQQQALDKMKSLSEHMQSVQQGLRQRQQQQVLSEMRRDVQDLLELSRREEQLKNESRQMEQNSPEFRKNAEEQMGVMRDLSTLSDRMSSLSQKTFAVTPEMGKAIGDAMRAMSEAMQSLDQRNGGRSSERQEGAMAALNQGAQLMQGAMEALQQGGGEGMGMAGFMQRLKQLSGLQEGINQGTKGMGGMTQEQAAGMARLAGEQGMVRKSLEELQREAAAAGELHKMLGDLSSVANEMREVQTDLAQGNVNPETIRKQDRILSRLLDAQRSTRERDYEKTRRAQTGKDIFRKSPSAIDLSSQEAKEKMRRDLLRAMEQGYTRDYEELIRKYFEVLESEPQPQQQQ
ncbi:MAG: DUF4175 family protein [Bacteroidota bacterium]